MRHPTGDSPAKTASAQSVRHAINAISIRIALHSQASVVAITLAGNLFSNSRERERKRERERVRDRNSAFYRRGASFPPARAKQTATLRWYVESRPQPFPPPSRVFVVSFALSFPFLHPFLFSPSLVLSFTRYDVSTFHLLVKQTFIIARVSR